jgi:hypothetical protein
MNTDTDKKYLTQFYELPQLKTISCNRLQAKLEPANDFCKKNSDSDAIKRLYIQKMQIKNII